MCYRNLQGLLAENIFILGNVEKKNLQNIDFKMGTNTWLLGVIWKRVCTEAKVYFCKMFTRYLSCLQFWKQDCAGEKGPFWFFEPLYLSENPSRKLALESSAGSIQALRINGNWQPGPKILHGSKHLFTKLGLFPPNLFTISMYRILAKWK